MNAITTTEPVSAQTLEHVLGTGDLAKLTTQQRVEYYAKTCQSLGLNPLTRPMRFLSLNGQIQLYFTRDGTDQLRSARGITLHIVDKLIDQDVFTVTVRARTKDGREDEDLGAVTLANLKGESRANALMKAITKAKRRVTLSICGLGQTDESELDTMPGARVFDAEDDVPVAPIRTARDALNDSIPLKAAAARTPPPERKVGPTEYDAEPAEKPQRSDEQWRAWVSKLDMACAVLRRRQEIVEIADRDSVKDAIRDAPDWAKRDIAAILHKNFERLPEAEPSDDLDEVVIADPDTGEVHIAGEEKVAG